MIDVLLTHSYFMHFDPKQARAMAPYPPLATLYAASVLRSNGFSVQLFDTMLRHSEDELRAGLSLHRPKVLAIYDDDFNYLNKMCLTRMREAALAMTRIAKEYGVKVIVHGSDASDHFEKYLSNGADAVLVGEGEQTLLEVCEQLLRRPDISFDSIPGVVFSLGGTLHHNAKRDINRHLDDLPFPAWDLIDHDRYRTAWKTHHGYFSLNMVTTRGCPFHCNWCAKPIYGQVYNARSPENVVAEILYLRKTLSPDHIWFADDIFGLRPGWVQKFSSLMNSNGIRIGFKVQSRADLLLQDDTVESLAAAGCDDVWIGAESGSQKILDAMEKGITVKQIYDAHTLLSKHGIRTSFFLQFGYLGETAEDIQSTIRMVKELRPHDIGISVSYPLPGTTFFDTVKSELGGKRNWADSDDLALMYRSTFSPPFYRQLHRYVHKVFRIRQGFQFLAELLLFRHFPTKKYLRRIAALGWYLPAIAIDRFLLHRLSRE